MSADSNAINFNVDGKTIIKDTASGKFKLNFVAQRPLAASGDKGDAMQLNFDNVTMAKTDEKLRMNYKAGDGITVTQNTVTAAVDGTTVTTQDNALTRVEQFTFDETNGNGFVLDNAESGKRSDRKLRVNVGNS